MRGKGNQKIHTVQLNDWNRARGNGGREGEEEEEEEEEGGKREIEEFFSSPQRGERENLAGNHFDSPKLVFCTIARNASEVAGACAAASCCFVAFAVSIFSAALALPPCAATSFLGFLALASLDGIPDSLACLMFLPTNCQCNQIVALTPLAAWSSGMILASGARDPGSIPGAAHDGVSSILRGGTH